MLNQTQPTGSTCMSTSIANLLEVDAFEVIKDFHDKYTKHNIKASAYLSDFLKVERCYGEDDIQHGYIYLICVPAIYPEIPGATHVVLADNRSGTLELIDPCEGRGPFYYAGEDTIKSAHAFKFKAGFTSLCRVSSANYAAYLEHKKSWETVFDQNKAKYIGKFSADLMEDLRIHIASEEKRAEVLARESGQLRGNKGEVLLVDPIGKFLMVDPGKATVEATITADEQLSWVGKGLQDMFPGTKSGRW